MLTQAHLPDHIGFVCVAWCAPAGAMSLAVSQTWGHRHGGLPQVGAHHRSTRKAVCAVGTLPASSLVTVAWPGLWAH